MAIETAEPTLNADQQRSGKAALEQLLPQMLAFAVDELLSPRVDVWLVGPTALATAKKVNEPQRRALFAKLPAEKFNMSWLDQLEPAALATMYVRAEVATADALFSKAKLPAGLASEVLDVRDRMLKLTSFHLGDHPKYGPVLADIRNGQGYADAAEDLLRLSPIYRENLELLSRDPSFYVAEDPDDAERLARQVQLELGQSAGQHDNPREMLARAWTLLQTTYEQIAVPGRWLFNGQGGDELFPSLLAVGRRQLRRKS